VLRALIDQGLVDYVAMDYKTSLPEYVALVGKSADPLQLRDSIELLKENRVDYEFRTTLIREIHTSNVLETMCETMSGSKRLYLQTFRNATTLNPLFSGYHPFSSEEMQSIASQFALSVDEVSVRSE
jgi:pyruvate formate lyase activating enzyme